MAKSETTATAPTGEVPRRPVMRRAALYVVLICAAVPFVFPFLWMLSSALKPSHEIFAYPPQLVPTDPRWENLVEVFTYQPFARHLFNSFYVAVLVTIGTCTIALLSGYAFARLRFRGSSLLLVLLLGALMMPSEVTIVPNFYLFRTLGLTDTHVPLVLLPVFGATGVFATVLMRQFFISLPSEVEEAGRIDGLGRLGIIRHIAFPLARPMLGAIGVVAFLNSWNLFLEPLVFISSLERFTVPLSLINYTDVAGAPIWHLQLAATTLSVIPIFVAYLLAQRQITESLGMTGASH